MARRRKLIEEHATVLNDLTHEIRRAYIAKRTNPDAAIEWCDASKRFFSSFDSLAFPGGLARAFKLLKKGDEGALEAAVEFLEADPRFFRSGYIKEDLIRFISRNPVDDGTRQRLQKVILQRINSPKTPREFRSYCRLAVSVTDDAFEAEVRAIGDSHNSRKPPHAAWVLERLEQAKSARKTQAKETRTAPSQAARKNRRRS